MTKIKKEYQKPKISRIRLDARQAVLAACTTVADGKIFQSTRCRSMSGCSGGDDSTSTS